MRITVKNFLKKKCVKGCPKYGSDDDKYDSSIKIKK